MVSSWIGCYFSIERLSSISDRPKPEFEPKPKYRNFGLVWTETETETERQSIPKPKPKPKQKQKPKFRLKPIPKPKVSDHYLASPSKHSISPWNMSKDISLRKMSRILRAFIFSKGNTVKSLYSLFQHLLTFQHKFQNNYYQLQEWV